jgi:hypothetical protein
MQSMAIVVGSGALCHQASTSSASARRNRHQAVILRAVAGSRMAIKTWILRLHVASRRMTEKW